MVGVKEKVTRSLRRAQGTALRPLRQAHCQAMKGAKVTVTIQRFGRMQNTLGEEVEDWSILAGHKDLSGRERGADTIVLAGVYGEIREKMRAICGRKGKEFAHFDGLSERILRPLQQAEKSAQEMATEAKMRIYEIGEVKIDEKKEQTILTCRGMG